MAVLLHDRQDVNNEQGRIGSGAAPPTVRRVSRRYLVLALLIFFALLALVRAGLGAGRPPDVDALLARLDDLYRSKSSTALIEILVVNPRTHEIVAVLDA